MNAGQARLYVNYVPGIVANLIAVLNTHYGQEPRVKTDLMASVGAHPAGPDA